MLKPQGQSLPVNNSSCQTGQAHQTSHCKKLEQASLLLFEAFLILRELSDCDFVKNSEWREKVNEISSHACFDAKELSRFYGETFIMEECREKKGGNNG